MKRRASCIGAIFAILIALSACGAETQPPTPTSVPSSPTPIPPTATPQLPTDTPAPPTAEPTTPPIAITTFEDMTGVWLRTIRGFELRFAIDEDGGATHKTPGFAAAARSLEMWFEDGLLYAREASSMCSQDQIGIYEVSGIPGEHLIFTRVEDRCGIDREFIGKWTESSVQ